MKTEWIAAVIGFVWMPAHAAVFQCSSATGEIVFTDAGCPPGYTAEVVVPDPPASAAPADAAVTQPPPQPVRGAVDVQRRQAAEAQAARLQAELDAERLRNELTQERLRAMDRKLDALLQAPTQYGAVIAIPPGIAPKPLPPCRGKPGQAPWANCRPDRGKAEPQIVPRDGPFCGIVGCTPGISRGAGDDPRGSGIR